MMLDDVVAEYLADSQGDCEGALVTACLEVLRLQRVVADAVSAGYVRRLPATPKRAPKPVAPAIEDPVPS